MGWKDILRPIRDGLRDNLPDRRQPEGEEDRRKRLRRRQSDALRGFAYLETFDELRDWLPEHVDAIQRANTPLLARSASLPASSDRSRLTVIHDFSGNYHEYESAQGAAIASRTYACEYLQFIDRFVYFSHKLVCIPPPAWTNTLHRNGVRSLGTFLVEPQTTDISEILEKEPSGLYGYWVAKQLIHMASIHGFDGWLVNIEKTFPSNRWSSTRMEGFLSQLRSELGQGNVIWYDSLTKYNMVSYQNSLTAANATFAKAAGSILVNYAWTPSKALVSRQLAIDSNIPIEDVILGIDVWAQNSGEQENPRKTWPRDGGGGTGTGLGVAEAAKLGLSVGIFAPAWPYEHFAENQAAVDEAMWLGCHLPRDLTCDCKPTMPHRTSAYEDYPITRFVSEYAAGTDSFFHTSFERSFQERNGRLYSQIGQQSILPCPTSRKGHRILADVSDARPSLVISFSTEPRDQPTGVFQAASPENMINRTSRKIFKLDMPCVFALEIRMKYTKQQTPEGLSISVYLEGTKTTLLIPRQAVKYGTCEVSLEKSDTANLVGFGVHIECATLQHSSIQEIMEIQEITIKRQGQRDAEGGIQDLRMLDKSKDVLSRSRLQWSIINSFKTPMLMNMPFSAVTGPFLYFQLFVNEEDIGRAYALEFILEDDTAETLKMEAEVRISGYGFDGALIATYKTVACDILVESGSWQMVKARASYDSSLTSESLRA